MIQTDMGDTFGSGQVTGSEFTFQLEITKIPKHNIGNSGSQDIGHQSREMGGCPLRGGTQMR